MPAHSKATAFVLGLTTGGLAAVRSLGRAGIPVVGLDWWLGDARTRYGVIRRCPPPDRPEEMLAFLIRQAEGLEQPGILVPARDYFVELLGAHQEELGRYFRFHAMSEAVRQAAVDKRRQYEAALALGVPCPKTFFPQTAGDLEGVEDRLRYPVFLKPLYSHRWRSSFKHKGIVVHNREQLREGFQGAQKAGYAVLAQEVIPGPDSNLFKFCTYIDSADRVLAAVVLRKLRQWPVHFGEGSLVSSVEEPEVARLGLRYCAGLGFRGIAEVEFKRDERDGIYKLMELNPRLWSNAQLVIDSGANLPLLAYLDLAGERPEPQLAYRQGVKWLRLNYDLRSFLWSFRHEGLSPWTWLRSLWGVSSHAYFAWDDPGPLCGKLADFLGGGVGRLLPARGPKLKSTACATAPAAAPEPPAR